MKILALLAICAVLLVIFLAWAMARGGEGITVCNAVPTMKRRELKNATVSFIPDGEVVDLVTTSKTTWPDAVPTTNYTDFSLPDIETLVEEIGTEEEPFLVPRSSGGYANEPETHLRSLAWTGTTAKTSSLMKKLQYALTSAAVAGTAQTPGASSNMWIDGVLLVELRGSTGSIIERFQIWARMTLADPGSAAAPLTSKLQVKWTILESGNNTHVALAA